MKMATTYFSPNLNFLQLFVLTLLVFQFFLPLSFSASCDPSDRNSLWYFYNSTSVYSPLKWSSSTDCCLWEGVRCVTVANGGGDRVTQLLLPFRGLIGLFPSSLRNLTFLTHLDLSYNQLYGSIPSNFFSSLNHLQFLNLSYNDLDGDLTSGGNISSIVMETLDLSNNHFSGNIIASLIQQVAISGSLTIFDVSSNAFTGSIPTSFCLDNTLPSVSSLRLLDFSSNAFDGQITEGLGNCSSLEVFRAGFNLLNGPIPSDLYHARTLKEISLQENHISGNIGFGIVNLTNLRILELYSNSLIGSIPPEIGKLSKLEQISLHSNNLTGTLPTSLMNCTNLSLLNLGANKLQGNLSDIDFSSLLRLRTLDLGNNMFTGSIPSTLYSCKSLEAIRLTSNRLSGEISFENTALPMLSFLSIANNQLTNLTGALRSLMGCRNISTLVLSNNFYGENLQDGDIIVDANTFQNIQMLALGGCHLTGNVPSWIGKLRNLQVLDLSFNYLVGPIPDWLGDFPSLYYIDLSNNQISGKFPISLCRLQALLSPQILDRAKQSFRVLPDFTAPSSTTSLNLQYKPFFILVPSLYLGNNTINGTIPREIGQLKAIHILDLSNNSFSGRIPYTISNLNNLEKLDLSHNHLTGKIPESLNGLTSLSWFSVSFNNLRGPIPIGGQFENFTCDSYEGNPDLFGWPIIVQGSCSYEPGTNDSTAEDKSSRESTDLFSSLRSPPCFIFSILTFVLFFSMSFFTSLHYF